jgi:hypothetical protein
MGPRALLVLGVLAILAVPAAARQMISVAPPRGSNSAHFVVRFRAPAPVGSGRTSTRSYVVSARGRAGRGCDASAGASVPVARPGRMVVVPLAPDERGWCRGTYHGQVAEVLDPSCSSTRLCPKYVAVLINLGSFRFRVR